MDKRFTEGMEREEHAYMTPKSSQFLESMSKADMYAYWGNGKQMWYSELMKQWVLFYVL